MTHLPKITFGIIVLNGEPFTRYCLRQIYAFAHEIIVVEGATVHAKALATESGHSTDGTTEVLYQFKEREDPHDKLKLITKNGLWSEKDEMSQAYSKVATGDYLWQVDIDEFYRAEDIARILRVLRDDPSITGMSFEAIHFWGGFDYFVQSGIMWHPGRNNYRRIFKFGPGYSYVTHRPPTVLEPWGRDVMTLNALSKKDLAEMDIFIYHYNALFPKQVMQRAHYYSHIGWEFTRGIDRWATETWMKLKRPLHLFHAYKNYSWLNRFDGRHPSSIVDLRQDIASGKLKIETRPTGDIESLLDSNAYKISKAYAQSVERLRLICSLGWIRH